MNSPFYDSYYELLSPLPEGHTHIFFQGKTLVNLQFFSLKKKTPLCESVDTSMNFGMEYFRAM
jgi:hypothetical protein